MDTDCESGYVCMEGYNGAMECQEPQPGVAKFGKQLYNMKSKINIHKLVIKMKPKPD